MTRTRRTTPAVRRGPWQVVLVGAALAALANAVVFTVMHLLVGVAVFATLARPRARRASSGDPDEV